MRKKREESVEWTDDGRKSMSASEKEDRNGERGSTRERKAIVKRESLREKRF